MPEQTGPWREVTPRVFVATCEPHSVNVGLVVGDEAALLVDTGNSPSQGRELLASARERAGVPVTHAVVTHHHADHWIGAAGMDDVVILAHEDLATAPPGTATVEAADALGLDSLPAPTETFSMARAVNLGGGTRVELLHLGAAHTACDVLVFVPDQNVILAGDLLEEGADPSFEPGGSVSNWPTVLDGALGASNAHTRFVPGHGDVVDQDFAFRQRAEIAMLYATAEMLIQQGTKLADAPAAEQWPFSADTLASALPLIYAELEAKGVKPRTQLPIVGA